MHLRHIELFTQTMASSASLAFIRTSLSGRMSGKSSLSGVATGTS
jgi:hypothetical protein